MHTFADLWERVCTVVHSPQATATVKAARTSGFALLCLLAFGCDNQSQLDLPEGRVWTSPHFRYATRADDNNVCASVVDQLEAHLQAIGNYLGLTWTGGEISYYKFRNYDDFRSNSGCLDSASACATSGTVRSPRALEAHELIHVYTAPLGHPPALFEEGIAEALAPEGRRFLAPDRNWRDILAMGRLADGSWPDVNYTAGAWFTTHLLRRFGPKPFLALYSAAAVDHSPGKIAEHFQEIYGQSLDQVWSEAEAKTPRLPGVPVWECASAKPLQLGDEAVPTQDSCDGRGAYAGLELPRPTTITWSDDSKLDFSVSGCSDGLFTLFTNDWHLPGAMALPAGKFYVAPGLQRKRTKLRQGDGLLGSTCHSIIPLQVGADNPDPIIVVIANSAQPWFAKIKPTEGYSFQVAPYPTNQHPAGEIPATVEVCESCQGPCHRLDSSSEFQVTKETILRFTNLSSFEGATVARMHTR